MANKKEKQYSEAELIKLFALERFVDITNQNYWLKQWIETPLITLKETEKEIFESIYEDLIQNMAGWNEEDLKMKFISFVLRLGNLKDNQLFKTYFKKTISAKVEGVFLKTKTDFMIAKGILDQPETPYFHFQEYKPEKNPKGDSVA
jgi:hypothetical protein